MVKHLNVKIEKDLLALLDKRRGDLPRDEFIEKILEEHLNDKRKDFSKLRKKDKNSASDAGEYTSEIGLLIDNFQEFANDIYNRLDRLEDTVNSQSTSKDSIKPIKIETDTEDVVFEIIEDSIDQNDDEKDERDHILSNETIDFDSSEDEDSAKMDSDFEYGCPFCNATISESADQCPSCGSRFDDYTEVQPVSGSYDYQNTESYDPRPEYLRRNGHNGRVGVQPYGPGSGPSSNTGTSRGTPNDPSIANKPAFRNGPFDDPRNKPNRSFNKPPPNCSICGGKLNYVADYKRWYCHRCRKFSGGPPPEPRPDSDTLRFSKAAPSEKPPVRHAEPGFEVSAHPIEPITEPLTPDDIDAVPPKKRSKQRSRDWRPLKEYHRYTD
jgi:hypothetical protein